MKVVVLGQGGREQALAQAILRSPKASRVVVIPGNPGMKLLGIECIEVNAVDDIVNFCRTENIDLVIPGNETVILSPIKEKLKVYGIKCFSPDPQIARLESSKVFCKQILQEAGILTADYQLILNQEEGLQAIGKHNFSSPLVLKADGLAQGKGVWVCKDLASALKSFEHLIKSFGFPVLFEHCLVGRELSAFAICQNESYSFLGTAVDYKRIDENPFSANTGGMGAYSPCHFIEEKDQKEIENIFSKILKLTAQKNLNYQGFLFAGLMKTEKGIAVIEFNVRMGDPETQALLPRLKSDILELLMNPGQNRCDLSVETSVHVVMTSQGYPTADMNLNHKISINNQPDMIFFSGVKLGSEGLINSGGRVLGITALAKDIERAREKAYSEIKNIHFAGSYFRKDIGL